jgi:hypothetical protein
MSSFGTTREYTILPGASRNGAKFWSMWKISRLMTFEEISRAVAGNMNPQQKGGGLVA